MKVKKPKKHIPINKPRQLPENVKKQQLRSVKIGLMGCGEVGGAVYRALNLEHLLDGVRIKRICVQHPERLRYIVDIKGGRTELKIPTELLSTPDEIVNDPEIGIVIDATAADLADTLVSAMRKGKNIVTANKALIARCGVDLERQARFCEVGILAEACVQGKVPVLRAADYQIPLKPFLISGLFSGTCGYILSELEKNPLATYEQVLTEAKKAGYAEADPTSDVEAYDATAKAKIIARVYFGAPTLTSDVDATIVRIGIQGIPNFAFQFAAAFKYRVQLVGTIERISDDKIGVLVMPTLVPKESFLGSLHGVTNGLEIHDLVGPPLEYAGPGAGGKATAAAIFGDLATMVTAIEAGRLRTSFLPMQDSVALASPSEMMIRPVFLSRSPENEPGVFRAKLSAIEKLNLSVEQVVNDGIAQETTGDSWDAIICKRASAQCAFDAIKALETLSCVHGSIKLMRVYGDRPFSFD